MEATCFSERSVDFEQITLRYIPGHKLSLCLTKRYDKKTYGGVDV
jgi:hypothetical protein